MIWIFFQKAACEIVRIDLTATYTCLAHNSCRWFYQRLRGIQKPRRWEVQPWRRNVSHWHQSLWRQAAAAPCCTHFNESVVPKDLDSKDRGIWSKSSSGGLQRWWNDLSGMKSSLWQWSMPRSVDMLYNDAGMKEIQDLARRLNELSVRDTGTDGEWVDFRGCFFLLCSDTCCTCKRAGGLPIRFRVLYDGDSAVPGGDPILIWDKSFVDQTPQWQK